MGVNGQLHVLAALPPGKDPLAPIGYEAGCTFHNVVRIELHINLKIDADALNGRWRLFCIRRTIYHIYQGQ
jgi:hypothetical protein